MKDYRPPSWLPGGHAQTIWPALFGRPFVGVPPTFRRERWTTPDGDFIDADWLEMTPPRAPGTAHDLSRGHSPATVRDSGPPSGLWRPGGGLVSEGPLLVLFHGLEGSSASHSSQAFAHWARAHGWRFVLPHFRGCSGEINRAPRAYHSGDFAEIGWMLQQARARHTGPMVAVGVSLGGNALLRWAEESGACAADTVHAVAAVCSPIDLAAGGHAIGRGFNRQVYTRMFLRSMVPKALAKWNQHPGLFDRDRLLAARTLHEFDNVFTAPLHGFVDADDYWARGSAKPLLHSIRLPALVLNARNDPFVPASSLPCPQAVGEHVTLWQPAHGGHVGFPGGRWPGHVLTLPEQVMGWMQSQLAPRI